ncbi:nectin-4-like [Cololabis saira]|uniref:nectin-4-like n=1 Tax=Cololabis saira TaxID=129043 RepID=UPI002AD4B581|nr:nectin-4-like [Cololabis saira]
MWLSTMKTCRRLSQLLLSLICNGLLPVLGTQKGEALPEVTGIIGHDVLLPCYLTHKPNSHIIQIQWTFLEPDGQKTTVVVLNSEHGHNISESPLKERVQTVNHSLQINKVEKTDAGTYVCTVITFPDGPFEKKIQLVVEEQTKWSVLIISVITTAALLLFLILAVVAYISISRRCDSGVRLSVSIEKLMK